MQITVVCRSKVRREYIESLCRFYARRLNLLESKYSLVVRTVTGLAKNDGMRGVINTVGPRQLAMALDSRLSIEALTNTVAHEMVHAKQFARGQIKTTTNRRGKPVQHWLGRRVECGYWDAPWELEAFRRERILVMELAKSLGIA